MNDIQEIRQFIVENFLFGNTDKLENSTDLFETGIINSEGLLELILFLEERFNIVCTDSEIVPQRFTTIEKTELFVKLKTSEKR